MVLLIKLQDSVIGSTPRTESTLVASHGPRLETSSLHQVLPLSTLHAGLRGPNARVGSGRELTFKKSKLTGSDLGCARPFTEPLSGCGPPGHGTTVFTPPAAQSP